MTAEERILADRIIKKIGDEDKEITLSVVEQDLIKTALQNMLYEDIHLRNLIKDEVKAAIKEINLEKWEFEHEVWKQVAEYEKSGIKPWLDEDINE